MSRCAILFVLIGSLHVLVFNILQGHGILSHSDTTNHRRLRVDAGEKEKRVVLFAGPHKTSSTSIQFNIIRWVNYDNMLPDWSWPVPTISGNATCGVSLSDKSKVFYLYISALKDMGEDECFRKFYAKQGGTAESLIHDYEQEFRNSWSEGNNLIIASEGMDFVSSKKRKTRELHLLNRILHGMPWNSHDDNATRLEGSNDVITVVVNFRAPRVEHLVSMWHQCCMDTMSFKEYLILYLPSHKDGLRSLDSLRLAEVFLERDLKVTLIDMSGTASLGYDISNVVACDVLGAGCTSNKTIVGDIVSPSKMNIKDGSHGATHAELEMMEKIIRNYDCNFLNITKNKKLTILYSKELTKIFEDCQNIAPSERIYTIRRLQKRLSKIGSNFTSIEDVS